MQLHAGCIGKEWEGAVTVQHTPGPWFMRPALDLSGDVGISAQGVRNVLAECFETIRSASERVPQEALANARLIAAAPELLVALEGMVTAFREDPNGRPSDEPECTHEAMKAIAKARGRRS